MRVLFALRATAQIFLCTRLLSLLRGSPFHILSNACARHSSLRRASPSTPLHAWAPQHRNTRGVLEIEHNKHYEELVRGQVLTRCQLRRPSHGCIRRSTYSITRQLGPRPALQLLRCSCSAFLLQNWHALADVHEVQLASIDNSFAALHSGI